MTGMSEFKSVREITYERLREAILDGEYAAGDRLKERDIATAIGVSTTPVKDALRRLEHEGLVVGVPLRGSYVASNIDTALTEMGLVRAALEGVAAKLAATKADDDDTARLADQLEKMGDATTKRDRHMAVEANTEFHQAIHHIAGNNLLHQMLEIVRSYDRVSRVRALADDDELERGLADHTVVFNAISVHDPELAETQMRKHILRSANSLVRSGKKRPKSEQ